MWLLFRIDLFVLYLIIDAHRRWWVRDFEPRIKCFMEYSSVVTGELILVDVVPFFVGGVVGGQFGAGPGR